MVITSCDVVQPDSIAAETRAACSGTSAYRTPVTVSNSGAEPITNGFVVVTLDHAASVAAKRAKADGGDLRFTDADCNALDFWVDHGLNTAAAKVWIKVPKLPVGETQLFALYGDPGATRTNDPAPLFGSNILAMYPMTEGAGTVVHDRVGTFDLELTGPVAWTPGPRQGIYALTGFRPLGRANRTTTKPALGTGDFTVFSTVFSAASSTDTAVSQGIFGDYANSGAGGGWVLKLQGNNSQGRLAVDLLLLTSQAGGGYCQGGFRVERDAWQTLGAKRTAGLKSGYKNGVSTRFSGNCAASLHDVSTGAKDWLKLGTYGTSTGSQGYAFDGKIAFTILYGAAKSDADMAALHGGLAMGSNVTVSNGKEELAQPGPGQDGGMNTTPGEDPDGSSNDTPSGNAASGCAIQPSAPTSPTFLVCGALLVAALARRRRGVWSSR